MKRSEFFKRVGLGAAAIIAAPSILVAKEEETFATITLGDMDSGSEYGILQNGTPIIDFEGRNKEVVIRKWPADPEAIKVIRDGGWSENKLKENENN